LTKRGEFCKQGAMEDAFALIGGENEKENF
jgi:hypothetical protein